MCIRDSSRSTAHGTDRALHGARRTRGSVQTSLGLRRTWLVTLGPYSYALLNVARPRECNVQHRPAHLGCHVDAGPPRWRSGRFPSHKRSCWVSANTALDLAYTPCHVKRTLKK